MKHWFLPRTTNVLGLLQSQTQITIEGMDAFVGWSNGDGGQAQCLADAEHAADRVRRQLQAELRAAFSTPLDAEDIYELSERLDAVLNGAKNAVREADLMGIAPDEALAHMAADLADGVRHLSVAFAVLASDAERATAEADAAIKCERRVEHTYRAAMARLVDAEDVGAVIAWRELYRRYARLGDLVVRVAERIWYAVVKQG